MQDFIRVKGANTHNLQNISLDIPKNKLIVITGVSGSGKSSLAFDTLYAEGQRRYIESLSAYARQFLGMIDKPKVDKIEGLPPAISIDQKSISRNPRSTVGTLTEINDYLRVLFARLGKPHCHKCKSPISKQTPNEITEIILQLKPFKKNRQFAILSPFVKDKKGEHKTALQDIGRAGFVRVRIDGIIIRLEEAEQLQLERHKKHSIEAVIDRIEIPLDNKNKNLWKNTKERILNSVELALKCGKGMLIIAPLNIDTTKKDFYMSENFSCAKCENSLPEIEPKIFSFNSPYGACPFCAGLGEKMEIKEELIVPNKNLTINEGAIKPWSPIFYKSGKHNYRQKELIKLSSKYKFSLNKPLKNLPKAVLNILFKGNKEFEGVIPNLERKWRETGSDFIRKEIEKYMVRTICNHCQGKRLKPESLSVLINNKNIDDLSAMPIKTLNAFFSQMTFNKPADNLIAKPIIAEIQERLKFLINVGLHYLTLKRTAATLSGGEAQRIRLATQIGSGLSGVLYILDEPSIGLHQRDQSNLIKTLKNLRDLGNTVIVVEHDKETIRQADWVIDIGPGAGSQGGKIIFEGAPKQLLKSNTATGRFLSEKNKIVRKKDIKLAEKFIQINGANHHNLKNISVKIPLNKFVAISGVSGSGKSTLINHILARALLKKFYQAKPEPGQHKSILGIQNIDKAIIIDQSPIGRTPRSNPATYTGIFDIIRGLFSSTRESRIRGYNAGRFSFNVKGGRCEYCRGDGTRKIEMHFLSDVYVECSECNGKRYNNEALEILYNNKTIHDILKMNIAEAIIFFQSIPPLKTRLQTLIEVGLEYLELGQSATTLSGGEAQRIKLAFELSKKATGSTLYILDEPTTGLHFADIQKLLNILHRLVKKGNSVFIIEHNLDIVRNADWIIDLGLEGGDKGGNIIAEGIPEEIKKTNKISYTAKYL